MRCVCYSESTLFGPPFISTSHQLPLPLEITALLSVSMKFVCFTFSFAYFLRGSCFLTTMCPQSHCIIWAFILFSKTLLYYYYYLASHECPNAITKWELPKVRNYISFPHYILCYIVLLLWPAHSKYTTHVWPINYYHHRGHKRNYRWDSKKERERQKCQNGRPWAIPSCWKPVLGRARFCPSLYFHLFPKFLASGLLHELRKTDS